MSDVYLTLEYDPLTRTTTTFHTDDAGQVTLRQHQDVSAILEANAMQRALPRAKNEVRKVASIPSAIYDYLQRSWRVRRLPHEEKQKEMKAFLNDPKFSRFRTSTEVV